MNEAETDTKGGPSRDPAFVHFLDATVNAHGDDTETLKTSTMPRGGGLMTISAIAAAVLVDPHICESEVAMVSGCHRTCGVAGFALNDEAASTAAATRERRLISQNRRRNLTMRTNLFPMNCQKPKIRPRLPASAV